MNDVHDLLKKNNWNRLMALNVCQKTMRSLARGHKPTTRVSLNDVHDLATH